MKVLLEGTQALRRYRGWGRYNLEVLLALAAAGSGLELRVFYNRNGLDDRWFSKLFDGTSADLCSFDYEPDEYLRLEEDFERSFVDESFPDIDVYHAVTEFPFFTRRAKLVTSIHEVTAMIYPENFDPGFLAEFSRYIRHDVERSDLLLTGSKSTATELIELCRADPARVRVIEYGVNEEFLSDRPAPPRASPYLTYVGSVLDRNKCFELLLRAFDRVEPQADLAVVTNEMDLPALGRRFGVRERTLARIRILPNVSDRQLADLYRGSDLFVFPACHEGFGLPLAEAMACRCPVLYADNSALVEVGGGHGVTFRTNDAADLADKLSFCLRSYPREDLEVARSHVAERFTWNRTATRYIEAYRELVG